MNVQHFRVWSVEKQTYLSNSKITVNGYGRLVYCGSDITDNSQYKYEHGIPFLDIYGQKITENDILLDEEGFLWRVLIELQHRINLQSLELNAIKGMYYVQKSGNNIFPGVWCGTVHDPKDILEEMRKKIMEWGVLRKTDYFSRHLTYHMV